jgi:hypothetical protein
MSRRDLKVEKFELTVEDFMLRTIVGVMLFIMLGLIDTASAASLSESDMVDFLTQSLCLDTAGKPTSQTPVIDNCASMRPQRANDPATYQKRDWPNQLLYPQYFLTGRQESDSVLINSGDTPAIEQTLDFGGDSQHQFGYFDVNDGGQVVLLVGGWASIVMTQDATGGVQWFIGEGCKRSVKNGKLSWLLFNQAVPSGRWAAVVATTALGHSPSDCPQQFNRAYTRYRREQITFPFRLVRGDSVTVTSRPVDVIVTDHFGGAAPNPASDAHLERFYSARHLGLLRWERWNNGGYAPFASRQPSMVRQSEDLQASHRCPTVGFSTSPGPGWYLVDCRTWTTIVKLTKPWSVSDYHWRAVEDADWR